MEPDSRTGAALRRWTPKLLRTRDARSVPWVTLGTLYLAGAAVGALSLVLPHPASFDVGGLWTNVAIAAAAGVVCLLGARRLPAWAAHVGVAAGTLAVTRAIYLSHDPASSYAFLYVWVGLYSFYFLPRRWAVAQVALVAVAYAWVLSKVDPGGPIVRWYLPVATVAVAGIVVDVLARRLRASAAESESRARSLEAVGAVAHELAAQTGADAARSAICRAAADVADASVAILWEPDAGGSALVATGSWGADFSAVALPFVGPQSAATKVFTGSAPLFVGEMADADVNRDLVEQTGAASGFWQPVLRDGKPAAVLNVVWTTPRTRPGPELYGVLELLAVEAAIAIARADVLARLERAAKTDELTGLPNRRAWEQELRRELARAERGGEDLCMAIIDLDGFKPYNDARGHQAGDLLLKELAANWRTVLRMTDVLARYGGDEFALALPGCPASEALPLLERLRRGAPAGITCSVGLAWWDGEEGADALVGRADAALYAAKSDGRDQIAVGGEAPVEQASS